MNFQHKALASGRWAAMPFVEQMANIGSEVERTMSWAKKGDSASGRSALDRALELLILTISDKKNLKRLRELTRLHETLVDYFCCDNLYGSSDLLWHNYFHAFNYAARAGR